MEKVLSIIAHILASIVPSLILKLCTAIFFLNNSFALHFTPVVSESSQMHKLSDPKSHLARAGSHQLTSNSQSNPTNVGAKTEWMVVGSRPVFSQPDRKPNQPCRKEFRLRRSRPDIWRGRFRNPERRRSNVWLRANEEISHFWKKVIESYNRKQGEGILAV